MNLSDFIEQLQEMLEEHGDIEVRIMSQPSWPFEQEIAGLVARSDISPDEDSEDLRDSEGEPNCVFILEGRQLCYGTKAAWEAAGSW